MEPPETEPVFYGPEPAPAKKKATPARIDFTSDAKYEPLVSLFGVDSVEELNSGRWRLDDG